MLAVEEANRFPPGSRIFLKLDASEMGAEELAESLAARTAALSDGRKLVVAVPDSAVSDTPYYREFRRQLRGQDIAIAQDEFAAGGLQLLQQAEISPQYVRLARSLVHAIHHHRERQNQIRSLVEAAKDVGAEVIAVGIRSSEEADSCRALGCRFGQGELFGEPTPVGVH
jgi:EAL domain-containing protein (putative c-di-GMP-specific phosphodiesterase class I)